MKMKNFKVLIIGTVISVIVALGACSGINSSSKLIKPLKADYPHWNFENLSTYKKLEKINTFIEANKGKNNIAVFDWDGTLYNENIPVKEMDNVKYAGQPAWYFWMARNASKFSFPVFPMFNTKDGEFINNVIEFNNYLEGKSDVTASGYNKFTLTALFTAGMTPMSVMNGTEEYLKYYRPEKYAFLPMLDVMQKMVNSGYNVWIITGSNPYFVAAQIKYIEDYMNYRNEEKYDFNICTAPYNPENDHIAGNTLKLLKNNRFSVIYDDRFVQNRGHKHYIVDGEGKLIVVKNLEKKYNSEVIFAAGNSGGDFYDVRYVVEKPYAMAIAVEPRGDLVNLVKDYPQKIVELNSSEI